MSQELDYLPFDMGNVQPETGGFKPYPEGYYMLKVVKTDEVKPVKDGSYTRRVYQSEIVMGPGMSEEFKGKKYYERISNKPEDRGQHMDIFAACFGSVEAARQVAMQHGGRLAPEMLHARQYIVQVTVSGSFNNVLQRLPATQQAWSEAVGSSAPGASIMAGSIPGAPIQQPQGFAPAPGPMPVMPGQGYAPPMQQGAPPMPQMQPPMQQSQPGYDAPQMQQPQMQPGYAPAPMPGYPQQQQQPQPAAGIPAPPPPPGTVAGQ